MLKISRNQLGEEYSMPKVIVADDEEFVRHFLKTILRKISFNVVAEVESGDELPGAMSLYNPDILLLDINMPNLTGIEFLKEYSSKFPKTCIIILTSSVYGELLNKESMPEVKCFLKKDMQTDEMIKAIQKTWLDFKKEV